MKVWIARDLSGTLILYKEKPSYNNNFNMWVGGLPFGELKGYSFPEITFENSPREIELKLC